MTDKMADQILKELEQSNRLVAELVKAVERQNEILDEKACLEDGESNGYDKENPKIPDWYWNVWDDYDCWSNSLNGNEITYRFLRKRGCPAYLAKTIASK